MMIPKITKNIIFSLFVFSSVMATSADAARAVLQAGKGSFSEEAMQVVQKHLKELETPVHLSYQYSNGSVEQTMVQAMAQHSAAFVALHNSGSGFVEQTVQALRKFRIEEVFYAVRIPVVMNLFRRQESKDRHLIRVYGHPQALKQIGVWLNVHAPAAKTVAVEEGAGAAAEQLSSQGEPGDGVIGPAVLGELHEGLVLTHAGIQDTADNRTLFALIQVSYRAEAISREEAEQELRALLMSFPETLGHRCGLCFE